VSRVALRPARAADLPAVNAVIEAAVATWDLPERVKRLALPSYRYAAHDLDHLTVWVATDPDGRIVGVAAWEPAPPADCPRAPCLLLHGLYVHPAAQGRGIGRALLERAVAAARGGPFAGLLVRAQPEAAGFFARQGLTRLPADATGPRYAHRYWLPTNGD